jgi:hypothetical protein
MPQIVIKSKLIRELVEAGVYDAFLKDLKEQWRDGHSGAGLAATPERISNCNSVRELLCWSIHLYESHEVTARWKRFL